jgi:hypothetical protein
MIEEYPGPYMMMMMMMMLQKESATSGAQVVMLRHAARDTRHAEQNCRPGTH